MRVTLPYAAATKPSALSMYVSAILLGRRSFTDFGAGSKFFNDFARARVHARARKDRSVQGLPSDKSRLRTVRRIEATEFWDRLRSLGADS